MLISGPVLTVRVRRKRATRSVPHRWDAGNWSNRRSEAGLILSPEEVNLMDAWYTLHTKPQSEVQVHRALVARGFETYLPMLPPRKERHAQPLFPAYLFVHCDMEAIGIACLQWIPGLRRVL